MLLLWTFGNVSSVTSQVVVLSVEVAGWAEVMEEIPVAFPEWADFKETLSALARCFGNFHRLDRFRDVCIKGNSKIPEARVCDVGHAHVCDSDF